MSVGLGVLAIGTAATCVASLVAFQLHSKKATVEHAALVCLALSQVYAAVTLLVGAALPLRLVYTRPDIVQMIHRSRYLVYDCLALPGVLWVVMAQALRLQAELGLPEFVAGNTFKIAAGVALAIGHLAMSVPAATDCGKYPLTADNCLGVAYWRPARFTHRMKLPLQVVTRFLWCSFLVRCIMLRQATSVEIGLLCAGLALRFTYHGHLSQYKYWSWEIFVQPLANAFVSAVLLHTTGTSVRCDWHRLNPSSCFVIMPGAAAPLFGSGLSALRF